MGVAGVFVLGLLIGSFLNVCIVRLPEEESIVSPRSRCPKCHTQLPWWANIPVLSYIVLRGRCAFCSEPISARYLLVEVLTAALFALAYFRFGLTLQALIAAAFVSALVVVTFIDIDHRIIPDVISLPGIAIGFAVSWIPGGISPADSAAGLLLGGGLLAGIAWLYAWWTNRGGLGMGDIKLLAMIGAVLGWTAGMLPGATDQHPACLSRRPNRLPWLALAIALVVSNGAVLAVGIRAASSPEVLTSRYCGYMIPRFWVQGRIGPTDFPSEGKACEATGP
jgi:leader peptidase (prepilin peptidase)/N-methyltransferase